jgi:hypothetical protein
MIRGATLVTTLAPARAVIMVTRVAPLIMFSAHERSGRAASGRRMGYGMMAADARFMNGRRAVSGDRGWGDSGQQPPHGPGGQGAGGWPGPPPPGQPGGQQPSAPPPGPSYPSPPGYPSQPWGPPGGPYPRPPETSSQAILALIAAILAWVFCPVIPAIVALVLCKNADREIAQSYGAKTGSGLVSAARIISWINLGLFGLLLLLLLFGVLVGGLGMISSWGALAVRGWA